MDLKEIRELLRLMEKFDVSDLSLARGESRVRLRRGTPSADAMPAAVRPASQAPQQVGAPVPSHAPTAPRPGETLAVRDNQFLVTSPIVGTFYRAPSPESPPYVEVGDAVGKGKVLCIVEAMKIMNEIECEVQGKVSAVLVENAQPVEYGQPLFILDLA